ncbi:MAG: DUF1634 domain-containing protein [Phycisphaerae bacterium]
MSHPAPDNIVPDKGGRMDTLVGYILLTGVLLSVTLIAAGLAWHWAASGELAMRESMKGTNLVRFAVGEIAAALKGPVRPDLLINLGIIALMLTPYARVLASVFYFALALRDWKYTAITAFVLAVLTYALFLS